MLISTVFSIRFGDTVKYVCGTKNYSRSRIDRLVKKFSTELKNAAPATKEKMMYKGNYIGIMSAKDGPYYQKPIRELRSSFKLKSPFKSFIILDKGRTLAAVAYKNGAGDSKKCIIKYGKSNAGI
ncbi:BgtE-20108 [Blumeria graminis f. sp. tritici]|uniref:BgtE-20108 n=1 Tax=Blumeria graminis f. sp. tritici TaxID=62690 RepID=A0A9X9PQF2_BLUGR|nr:BgtE-20108 [Blumeria graminis f. sp. tritici]